jgi:hypothetical protein
MGRLGLSVDGVFLRQYLIEKDTLPLRHRSQQAINVLNYLRRVFVCSDRVI